MLLGLLLSASAAAQSSSLFVDLDSPAAVVATPDQVFVNQYCGSPRNILSIDSSGNISVFATLPSRGDGCYEDYMALSSGLGGFPADHLYVVAGQHIYQVSPDGAVTPFGHIPSLPDDHNGIAFDNVGTFGYDMIIVGMNGELWRIDAAGNTTKVTDLPGWAEGIVVAPMDFAPYGGHMLLASENTHTVFALSPEGDLAKVAKWPFAEKIHVIPENIQTLNGTDAAFFAAVFPTHIKQYPASAFDGLGGNILVTSEYEGIAVLSSDGQQISLSVFDETPDHLEGSSFIVTSAPTLPCESQVGWQAPLHHTEPYHLQNGEILPIRFAYDACDQFAQDESVVVQVVDKAHPDTAVTAWVYKHDVEICQIENVYMVDFLSHQYGLAPGQELEVQVFMGGELVGTAPIIVVP